MAGACFTDTTLAAATVAPLPAGDGSALTGMISAAAGVFAAIFFYFVLEVGFQVSLLKGPLEAALGLY